MVESFLILTEDLKEQAKNLQFYSKPTIDVIETMEALLTDDGLLIAEFRNILQGISIALELDGKDIVKYVGIARVRVMGIMRNGGAGDHEKFRNNPAL